MFSIKILTLFALALLIGVSKGFCEVNTHSSSTARLIQGARAFKSANKAESGWKLAYYFMGYVEGVISSHKDELNIPATTPHNEMVGAIAGIINQAHQEFPEDIMKVDRREIVLMCLRNLYPKKDSSSANSVSVPTNGNEFPITFSDPYGIFEIQILEILKAQEILDRGLCYRHQLEEASKSGKKYVYFFVKVTNKKYKNTKFIPQWSFQLESVEGEISEFSTVKKDGIKGDLSISRSTRGGVMFAYYNDQTPKTLIFSLGLIDVTTYGGITIDEEEIFAKSPDLSKFFK